MARPEKYGKPKKDRKIRITDEGWDKANTLAEFLDCDGVSDIIEQLARGYLVVSRVRSFPDQKQDS